jgi:hypothetical protein
VGILQNQTWNRFASRATLCGNRFAVPGCRAGALRDGGKALGPSAIDTPCLTASINTNYVECCMLPSVAAVQPLLLSGYTAGQMP